MSDSIKSFTVSNLAIRLAELEAALDTVTNLETRRRIRLAKRGIVIACIEQEMARAADDIDFALRNE